MFNLNPLIGNSLLGAYMKFVKCYMVANLILAMLGSKVFAVTEVNWWHAMGGQLGEMVDKFASDFNKTQSEYKINAIYKARTKCKQ